MKWNNKHTKHIHIIHLTIYDLLDFRDILCFLPKIKLKSSYFWGLPFQIRLYCFVLAVEISHIHYQILNDEHMSQRSQNSWFTQISVDCLNARQFVKSITIHWARPTNAFSAGSPQRERRIVIVLYVQQGIQVHRRNLLQIHIVTHILREITLILNLYLFIIQLGHIGI